MRCTHWDRYPDAGGAVRPPLAESRGLVGWVSAHWCWRRVHVRRELPAARCWSQIWWVSWVGTSVAGAVLRGSFLPERMESIPEMLLADPRPRMRETGAEHHFVGPDGDEAADSLPM